MNPLEQSVTNQQKAQKIIRRRMLYAGGLGFIPVPIVDAIAILSNQVLMIRQLSKLYEIPFKEHLVKSLIGALVGNLGTIGLMKFIPGLGSLLGGAAVSASAVASTYALGKIFTQHFDQGGTLLDFDPVKSSQYFQQLHQEGELVAQTLKEGKEIPLVLSPPVVIAPEQATSSNNASAKKRGVFYSILRWVFILILFVILVWASWQAYLKYGGETVDAEDTITEIPINPSDQNILPTTKVEPELETTIDTIVLDTLQ